MTALEESFFNHRPPFSGGSAGTRRDEEIGPSRLRRDSAAQVPGDRLNRAQVIWNAQLLKTLGQPFSNNFSIGANLISNST